MAAPGRFASHFDIQWEPPDPKLHGKVLIPILGDHYERVLDRGELALEAQNGEPVLRYFENRFPITSDSIPKGLSIEKLNSNRAALDKLIQKQNYCLAFWGEGDLKLNYRRFFAVNTLAAVRVEDEKVFNDVHGLLEKWLKKKWLDGLRVDHPDGLREPKKYTECLRALARNSWIIVEKILQPKEEVPENWPVEGTVGYDFLNQVNGLFIQRKNQRALTDFYSEFTGEPTDPEKFVREKKCLVLESLFTTEVSRLVDLLAQIAARRPAQQNFSRDHLREAVIEFAACFPVYRTYVRPAEDFVDENDLAYIKQTTARAKKSRRDLSKDLFDFLNDIMLLLFHGELESEFVARFQQLTGPAMAKGVEDTTFFCLNHFTSLNEVGGDPAKFGVSDDEFHEFCRKARRTADVPCSAVPRTILNVARMYARGSTCYQKIPDEWHDAVVRWSKMNERHRKNNFPDRNAEYLFYQTLIGAWPISLERILAYMEKASCEAKQHTDWNHRNTQYDETLKHFVTAALADANFTKDLEKFIAELSEAAQTNSLAQTLIKLTAPGAPDIYQGNEIWDFSLVDPDNRRPVDFQLRNVCSEKPGKLQPKKPGNVVMMAWPNFG